MTTEPDAGSLEKQLNRLTTERTALFALAGGASGLSKDDHARLTTIERQIDDCFLAIRQQRAEREARRFTTEGFVIRRGMKPTRDTPTR